MERALATIDAILEVADIPGADAIERVRVRGWDVVTKKGEFAVGDLCVYFEIDSLLDVEDPRFAFLAHHGVRADSEGRKGHVLKTAKLRGQYSQGLVLPIREFPELAMSLAVGVDVTSQLGVVKYEPPLPAGRGASIVGGFPSWIPKTDEERIQNIPGILATGDQGLWVPTEKLDGSSTTYFWDPTRADQRGICGRNWELALAPGMPQLLVAERLGLFGMLEEASKGTHRIAIQGEFVGPGVQANPLGLPGPRFVAFGYLVDGARIPFKLWPVWAREISVPEYVDLQWPATVDEAVVAVDGLKSLLAPGRAAEGVVWRNDHMTVVQVDGEQLRASAKVISRKYLLKNDR